MSTHPSSIQGRELMRGIALDLVVLLAMLPLLSQEGALPLLAILGLAGLLLVRAARMSPLPWLRGPRLRLAVILVPALALSPALAGILAWNAAGALVLLLLLLGQALVSRGPQDDLRTLILALLLLLLCCSFPAVALLLFTSMVLLALLLPWALTLCLFSARARDLCVPAQHERRGPPLLLPGLGVLLFAVLLYLILPRPEGLWVPGDRLGVGEELDLDPSSLQEDALKVALVVRVLDLTGAPVQGSFYYRGVAFDHFDGGRWLQSRGTSVEPLVRREGPGQTLLCDILQRAPSGGVLFGIPEVQSIDVEGRSARAAEDGTWRVDDPPSMLRYRVRSLIPASTPQALPRALPGQGRYLALPASLDPRVRALAWQTTQGRAGARAQLQGLVDSLRGGYRYSEHPSAAGLEDFLFVHREGSCEHFASALAVLGRALGIPTRLVNGFHGGGWDPERSLHVLRDSDSHAWVEAWSPETGWETWDATPDAGVAPSLEHEGSMVLRAARLAETLTRWDRQDQSGAWGALRALLLGPDTEQVTLAGSLPRVLGVALGLATVLLLVARRLASRWTGAEELPRGRVHRSLREAQALARRRGWSIPRALPPLEGARWLLERAGPGAAPLEQLALLHYRVRYGGEDDHALRPRARELLGEMQLLARRDLKAESR